MLDIDKYSEQLRTLGDAYYHGHISQAEYRQQRSRIFKAIEDDLCADDVSQMTTDDTMLDRLMSIFKTTEKDEHTG